MHPSFLIADTNSVYRYGIISLLKEHFTICSVTEINNTGDVLNLVEQNLFHAVLMEVNLPPENGFNAARAVLQRYGNCRIILYAGTRSEEAMIQSFAAGAAAFFFSDETPAAILHKTEQVLTTGCCITADTFDAYKAAHKMLLQPQNDNILTPREIEILQLIQKGFTNKQIAAQLFLSDKTVKNYRNNIMGKTDCHNVAQLLLYAQQNGLV